MKRLIVLLCIFLSWPASSEEWSADTPVIAMRVSFETCVNIVTWYSSRLQSLGEKLKKKDSTVNINEYIPKVTDHGDVLSWTVLFDIGFINVGCNKFDPLMQIHSNLSTDEMDTLLEALIFQ